MNSSLIVGSVMHRRETPVENSFVYPIFYLLLDLDELEELNKSLSWFGLNRFAAVAYYDRDHLGDPHRPARDNVEAYLRQHGIEPPGGRIMLLTMPRIFGYVFNPVSFFYCYDADDHLALIVAEVNNTWRERHPYILTPDKSGRPRPDGALTYHEDKVFYVSPFIDMDARYEFAFSPLADRVYVHIDEFRERDKFFTARLWGDRLPLTDANLRGLLIKYPLSTLMVIIRIVWQAAKLWLWRVPVVKKVDSPI